MEIDQIPSLPRPQSNSTPQQHLQHQQQQPQHHQQPNPHHRKVELQSPLDLAYLRANIERAARERLDLHIPRSDKDTKSGGRDEVEAAGSSGEDGSRRGEKLEDRDGGSEDDDPLRARVSAFVSEFLDQTWRFAGQSISINGNDVDVAALIRQEQQQQQPQRRPEKKKERQDEDHQEGEKEGTHFLYEPHDQSLSTHLASLYADLERETLAVSRLRRVAPAQGAKSWGDALLAQIDRETEFQPRYWQQEEKEEEGEGSTSKKRKRNVSTSMLPPPPQLNLNLNLDSKLRNDDGEEDEDSMKAVRVAREETEHSYERGLADLRQLISASGGGGGGEWKNDNDKNDNDNDNNTAAGTAAVVTSPHPQSYPQSTSQSSSAPGQGLGPGLTETLGKIQRAVDVVAAGEF